MARTAFMGTPEFALPSLEALARASDLQMVVAQPDKPSGRGHKLTSPPTASWAREHGVRLRQPARARDESFLAEMAGLGLDLVVVAAYGKILPKALLDAPRRGCINVHASLLPKYRGAAPIQWAIAQGERETGITLMRMDEGLDTGPMLAQSRLAIGPQETGGSLSAKLAELGGRLLGEKLPSIFQGSLVPTPQDSTLATLAPRLTREDALLDFSRAAAELHDRVRAFHPWPGATIRMASGGGIKVLATAVAEGAGRPGEILAAGKDGIVVAAGAGALRLLEVQPEGKRPMKAFEFLHGHPLAVGSLIGAS